MTSENYLVRVSKAVRDWKSYGKGKMSFVWCQGDVFHVVSRKLCYKCAKQDHFGPCLTFCWERICWMGVWGRDRYCIL